MNVEGSSGLRLRLGVDASDLVSDLRAIAAVCRQPQPHPDLAFVENIQPTTSRIMIDRLDAQLETILGESNPDGGRLTLAVPESALADLSAAHAFRVRIGSALPRIVPRLEMADILRRTRLQRDGQRLNSLRHGHVELLATDDGTQSLGQTPAVKWIEATASLNERRFFLMEGQWYELAAGYYEEVRAYVSRFLERGAPSLDLPTWQPDMHERDYNLHVNDVRGDYLCLDRRGVTTRLHRTHGVEICDLLGPDDELIHVKHADGSAPLSHLFSQGLVSARTLIDAPEARKKFSELVAAAGNGRTIDQDFVPKKIVFAILLKQGDELTVETLFPFAQVMLRQTALYLEGKAEVEVIPIRMSPTD